MVYEKCIIWIEKDKVMKYVAFCRKLNIRYAACLKNAINFLVAMIYKMNFHGCFLGVLFKSEVIYCKVNFWPKDNAIQSEEFCISTQSNQAVAWITFRIRPLPLRFTNCTVIHKSSHNFIICNFSYEKNYYLNLN
jgi:hypothetical protein